MKKEIHKLSLNRISNAGSINDNLICMNCKDLAIRFVMVCQNNDYRLCKECYDESVKSNKQTCPNCNSIDPFNPNKVTKEDHKQLLVICKYKDKGCPNTPSFMNYFKHEEECPFRPFDCKDCGIKDILFKEKENHLKIC